MLQSEAGNPIGQEHVTPAARRARWRWRSLGSYAAMPAGLALVMGLLLLYLHLIRLGGIDRRSLAPGGIEQQVVQHLVLTLASTAIVVAVAIPLGVLVTRSRARAGRAIVTGITTLGQAAPPLGLMVLAAFFIGTGSRSAIYALAAYAALPVLRNTITGLDNLDRSILEAARGTGMSAWRTFIRIEFPLATPVMMAGIRTAIILDVSTAALATFISGGGLGTVITSGISLDRTPVMVTGSVLVAVLALGLDWVVRVIGDLVSPRGLREGR